ncbi:MAG TPA: 23S rRNA (adenine(2503)-C(2))-methyltransferase RlmN [Candidatus Magasanikbacteria bacterium]|nr:MAG: 23S rRNA (adenine(2503)-C(2))-methyltransferase [Candidatus Magasanikbacteria bacterium RIFOXYC2_FULL_39_8]HAT03786.1 23S rRNA (adenine(2503)-C(2))-methyltransferase RlmN [Candidatus Magasanikbacteria bacterium]
MNLDILKDILHTEPTFRFRQAWKAIFQDLIEQWDENTTLPKQLRERLHSECPLEISAEMFGSQKSDSQKALITLEDNEKIETVLLNHRDKRHTLCVSTQVGCAMKCAFCATGKLGLKRNLTTSEIVDQVLLFARYMKKHTEDERIGNIVFMGMGEPFANYTNVMSAIRILNDKDAFNIGARHISISTSGVVDGIKKLASEDLPVNLAISLHAPNDALRSRLMPINKVHNIDKLMKAVGEYVNKKNRQVMFEYLMIDGVNDTQAHATELALFVKHPLYIVNLIRYNPTGVFEPSRPDAIRKFKNTLLRAGVKVTERHEFGQDIDAACGQLAGKRRGKD